MELFFVAFCSKEVGVFLRVLPDLPKYIQILSSSRTVWFILTSIQCIGFGLLGDQFAQGFMHGFSGSSLTVLPLEAVQEAEYVNRKYSNDVCTVTLSLRLGRFSACAILVPTSDSLMVAC